MHIGLLEESPAIAEFLCTALHMARHTISVHASAASLLEGMFIGPGMCAPQPYDLIILDVLIDKPEELLFLAQIDRTILGQPLVVITASHANQIAQTRQAYPHIAFLPKPFHLEVLSAHIEGHVVRPTETSTIV